MRVLCDNTIPDRLIRTLQNEVEITVINLSNHLSGNADIDNERETRALQMADVLFTAIHKYIQKKTRYGVIHYDDPTASYSYICHRIVRLKRVNNPYSHINDSVP